MVIELQGHEFRHVKTYKHDSWAATALYSANDQWIVCKFNRRQSIFGFPMYWLGNLLARREERFLVRLADVPNIPDSRGPVRCQGRVLHNAVAHQFVPGRPLRPNAVVNDQFFPTLSATLAQLHRRGIAYLDLHKLENILVGEDGRPYLIDFQISVQLPRWWPFSWVQHLLEESDRYHWQKHFSRLQPDPNGSRRDVGASPPWWIGLHRMFAVPFRQLRRTLLVILGIRRRGGMASTEACPEEAFRLPLPGT